MPWIYNPLPQTQSAKAFDGSALAFPPRKKTYVRPDQMSAYVWNLIRAGKLANRGGDPKPPKPRPAPKPAAKPAPIKKVAAKPKAETKKKAKPKKKAASSSGSGNTDTSSSHHQTRGKVGSESSGTRSVKKDSKAEKKQPDIHKKADTQGNQDKKIEADAAEKPKRKRKRTFKRKG